MYERTHSSTLLYEQNICCFWERLTRRFEIFIFELVGRKEISIVHVTYSFQPAVALRCVRDSGMYVSTVLR